VRERQEYKERCNCLFLRCLYLVTFELSRPGSTISPPYVSESVSVSSEQLQCSEQF
jgi:hypothetical protein